MPQEQAGSLTSKANLSPCQEIEIVIAFSHDPLLKGTLMAQRGPALFTATPRSMSRLAIIFLVLAAVFGLLNSYKVKALRANVASTQATGDASPGHGQVAAKSNAGTAGLRNKVKPLKEKTASQKPKRHSRKPKKIKPTCKPN